jgi:hypothetical protein
LWDAHNRQPNVPFYDSISWQEQLVVEE